MGEKRILWADDDPDDHLLIKECLQQLGRNINLIEAFDGEQALGFLENAMPGQLPSLIVLDINMPRISGKEAAAKIIRNDKFRNIPLILFTTARNGNDELFCRKNGLHLVYKPWSFTETLKTIADILDNYTLS